MANVEFENCDFCGTDFSNSRLINVQFINCKNLDESIMESNVTFNVSTDQKGNNLFEKYSRYKYNLNRIDKNNSEKVEDTNGYNRSNL